MRSLTRYSVLILSLWFFIILFLLLRPIDDVDVFWQIKQGELMVDQKSLCSYEIFTYTYDGTKAPSLGWLAQIIFAMIFRWCSWPALHIFHVLLFSGAFLIIAYLVVHNLANGMGHVGLFSLGAAVILGFLVSLNNSSLRPQSFAVLSFASLLYIVQSDWRLTKKILVLVPILFIWQNTHPSVATGTLVMGVLVVVGWIESFKRTDMLKPWGLSGLFLVVFLSQFATPMGWHIFEAGATNFKVAHDWLGVTEWLPPWHQAIRFIMLPFWIALVLSLILIIKLRFKLSLIDTGLFISMTLLTLSAARFVLFWALIMIPIWAHWIEQVKPSNFFSWRGDIAVNKNTVVATFLIGIIFVTTLSLTLRRSLIDQSIWPIRGMQTLKSFLSMGRIYNTREWGSPLIFAGYPNWKVHVYGRLYLFKDETFWKDYNNVARGEVSLRELVERYRPDAFFLHPVFHQKLIQLLRSSSAWRELYGDSLCVIFLPINDLKTTE